jgi:hypothetical protein
MDMLKINQSKRIFLISAVVLMVSLACSIGGLTINRDSATLDVTLSEDQLDTLIDRASDVNAGGADEILEHIDDIELHDGYMRLIGSTMVNGNTANGSVDVSLNANEGALEAEIIAVDIPGVDMNDARIQEANQTIARELTEMVNETNGDVVFQRVEVHEDELVLTVQVSLDAGR